MDKNRTVVAYFTGDNLPYEITLDAITYSRGTTTINASFGSVTCVADGLATSATVNVTATAAKGYRFDRWSGAFTGNESTISFIKTSSSPLTAHFSEAPASPWYWVVIGIAAVVLIVVLVYKFKLKKAKGTEEAPADTATQPQP